MRRLESGALDPFAQIRARTKKIKAELQARHAAGPPEFLNACPAAAVLMPKSSEFDPPFRRSVLLADHKVRAVQAGRRRHRSTGLRPGPRRDDRAIAREVRWYERDYLMPRNKAMRLLAHAIAGGEHIEMKSAMARVRRALLRF